MFGLFNKKKRLEEIQEETKKGFEAVKKDVLSVSGWIKHLDSEKNLQKKDIDIIKEDLSSIKEDLEGLKNAVSFLEMTPSKQVFKQSTSKNKRVFYKQTAVSPVQTGVQTSVQTPNLSSFSITERAILLVLLNADMKLSYEDLAAMLNKEKSTIRGQINSIKSKGTIIEEIIEINGKKRVFIPEKIKEKLLKKKKVRVKSSKN
ncbi:MAG: hypothetical protein U9Q99_01440 [Nanoarchaeota archaeon]|nr:hypothetical protein [Nanoarchaeota archaeon]